MYSKNAFTLVELIVWITISMLLMTSVWMLVSSGMQNILKQQNIMDKNSLLIQTVSDFYNWFENIVNSWGYVYHSQSWAIFQVESYMNTWWFGYLWISDQSNLYCSDDSEFPNLNYLTWKSFIPYEEIWEDIFNDFNDIYTQEVKSWSTYTVDTLNHQVLEDWIAIIWWDIFGHELSHWETWTYTSLNNPTGIVLAEWGFFLSDTLNHRILFYKDGDIFLILDQNDWINQPTGLEYDDTKNILYIANSWKWEILSLSAEILWTNPSLDLEFFPIKNINSINRIRLDFTNFLWTLDPIEKTDIVFNNINKDVDYSEMNWNIIDYYFSDYAGWTTTITPYWFINNCNSSSTYFLDDTTPTREDTTCDIEWWNTWSTIQYYGDTARAFLSNNNYWIQISNIDPDLSEPDTYLIKVDLFNHSILEYSDTFKYFTQWDGIVNNLDNVTLKTVISGLWYPTWMRLSWNNLEINDFITRKQYSYDLDNISSFSSSNLNDFSSSNLENIPYSKNKDIILENPIAEVNINYNATDKFLSTQAKYYQYLNCYNPDEQVQKTLILQKNID